MISCPTSQVLIATCICSITLGVVLADPPEFVEQPAFQETVCPGHTAACTLQVDFLDGTDPVLQWQFNGADISDGDRDGRVTIVTDLTNPSAATSSLTITDTDPALDAGSYRCLADTSNNGGTFSLTATLAFHDAAGVDPQADPAKLCVGDGTQLTVNPTGSDPPNQIVVWTILSGPNISGLQFSPGPTNHDPLFTPTDPGTYSLRGETIDSLCSASAADTLTIEVYEALEIDPAPAEVSACIEAPVPLTANPTGGDGNYEFAWSIVSEPAGSQSFFLPNNAAENPTFTATTATSPGDEYVLSVVARTTSGSELGCSDSEPGMVTLTVVNELNIIATADSNEICLPGDTGISTEVTPADGIFTYAWSIVSPSPDTDPAQLSGTTEPAPVFTPSTTTEPGQPYVLRVAAGGGFCTEASDTVSIVVHDTPAVTPTALFTAVCIDYPTELSANPSGSGDQGFVWSVVDGPDTSGSQFSPFPTVETPTFAPSTVGTYELAIEVFDNVCDSFNSATIEIQANPALSADPTPTETTVCVQTPVALSANPAGGDGDYTFLWTIDSEPLGSTSGFLPDAAAQNPTFAPTVSGTYVLQVMVSDDGCDDSEPATVTIDTTDQVSVTATAFDSDLCLGDNTLLIADAGGGNVDYTWTVGEGPDLSSDQFSNPNASAPLFTPSMEGDYTLGVQAASGECSPSEDSVMITVHSALSADPTASPQAICIGDDTQLDANQGGSGAQNQIISWIVSGGPDTSSAQFSNPTIANPRFTPTAETVPENKYELAVEVTDLVCGDLVTGDVTLTVYPPLTADPVAEYDTACEGIPVQLSANPEGGGEDYSFTWSIAGGPSDPPSEFDDANAEQPMFTPAVGPTTYTLSLVLEDESCDPSEPVYFLVLSVEAPLEIDPAAEFDIDPDAEHDQVALGVPTTLHANPVGGTSPQFTWSVASLPQDCAFDDPISDSESEDPTFTANCLGHYVLTVVARDDVCDAVSAGLVIDVIIFTAAPSAAPAALCVGGWTLLSPNVNLTFGPYDYTWTILDGPDVDGSQLDSASAEFPEFTPTSGGTYTIQVEADDQAGLLPVITGQLDIDVADQAPVIDIEPIGQAVCLRETTTISITASGDHLTYQWRRDEMDLLDQTAPELTIDNLRFTDAADYSCVVTNGCGEISSQDAVLTVETGLPLSLLAVPREDTLLHHAKTDGCTVTADFLDRGEMGSPVLRATGLATDPITGTLYAAVRTSLPPGSAETWLATLNPYTGAATIIDSMGEPISDLAFHPDGTLYAARGNQTPVVDFQQGEIVTVDLNDASLTSLDPVLSFGTEGGHSIAFDMNGVLYHHGRQPNVYSKLNSVILAAQSGGTHIITLQKEYGAPFPEWTAMTIYERDGLDLFLAATRSGELWSIDPNNDYEQTVLGSVQSQTGGDLVLMGLAFACATPGDMDCDGDIDSTDYVELDACLAVEWPGSVCDPFDHDGDLDVDLLDWAQFQRAFTGSAP